MTAYVTPVNLSYVQPGTKIEFAEQPRSNSIRFHGGQDNTEVGRFEIVDGQMRFTGNTDETAKVMIEVFLKQFNAWVEADKKAVREQALLDAMNATRAFGKTGEVIATVIRGLK